MQAAREAAYFDAVAAGLADDDIPLRDGGQGARAYSEAVSVYLSFALSRATNRSATVCVWNTIRETIEQVFARQAIPMTWDYPESNLLSDSTGNWLGNMDWIGKVLKTTPSHATQGYATQQDAAQVNGHAVTLSTDPPYYDNIGYADLSDFFYIWMRRSLRDIYPDVFGTMLVPKAAELIASRYRQGGKDEAKTFFEDGMLETFRNIRKFVTDEYPLTVYYAFKQQDARLLKGETAPASTGWETMLTSLIQAGFSIVGTWPMRTERPTGVKAGTNALASSIILVCRPRPADAPNLSRRHFLQGLRTELPPALKAMQSGNIAPVDLAQASIGPGMAIYSRAGRALESDGTAMSVRTALALINDILDEHLAERDGQMGAESRFAVDWFAQHGFEAGEYGGADVLARAKNTSVETVRRAGLVDAEGGRVRLRHWSGYDPGAWEGKRLTVWEGTHHLIERLDNRGERAAARLLLKLPDHVAGEARQLTYRLYHICERQGWAEHGRYYNALIVSWPQMIELAAGIKHDPAQMDLL